MSDRIVLSWDADVSNTPITATQAAAALAAVVLYANGTTDPVLGQLFGLTVDSDVTSEPDAVTARRTLTLNMNSANAPEAPPPFPCHPLTSTPPVLPYRLQEKEALPGTFFVTNSSASVPTSDIPAPWATVGTTIEFLSQIGVFYQVAVVGPTSITLSAPYTGRPGNVKAAKVVDAPVTVAAIYSSSESDTSAVATVPPIPNGPGARTIELTYDDSTGAGPFTTTVTLTGKRPAAVTLAMGSVDIAEIINMTVASAGDFENSIGEITLCELSEALPALPPNLPLGTGIGAAQEFSRTFKTMTDEAQMLIETHLAYLPPSFFALAQQAAAVADTAAPPTDNQLSRLLGEFVNPTTAAPPPVPPLSPATIAEPTYLSGMFARTLQLGVQGAKITARTITFL